jgi:shikimate dehydrogenase
MDERMLFGLFAHPVHHSLSPVMHNAAFAELGLAHHYQAFDIHPEQLEMAMKGIRALGIGGVNVSIPHKENVIPYLDEIDDEARVIGAVNTIVHQRGGRLKGYNTDGAGYVQSLLAETSIALPQTKALLIGAGGAAKGIAVYLLKHGCSQLTVANRTKAKAEELALQLEKYIQQQGLEGRVLPIEWSQASQEAANYDLIVNTTPIGMWPNSDQIPISLKGINASTVVSDIVYNPLTTQFLKEAAQLGATTHQGLGMFIYQGALAFKYFTGKQAPVDRMKEVVLERLQQGG